MRWVSGLALAGGLVVSACGANAQMLAPYGGTFDAVTGVPSPTAIRNVPRPPAPIPHVASRNVPLPVAKPTTGNNSTRAPQSAATEAKPGDPPAQGAAVAPPPPGPTVGQAKPAPQILPTQEMPKAQGLD